MARGPSFEVLEGRFKVELRRDARHQGEPQWQHIVRDPENRICKIYTPDVGDKLQPEDPRQRFSFVVSNFLGDFDDPKSGWRTEYWEVHLTADVTNRPSAQEARVASQDVERELAFNFVDRDDNKGKQWQAWVTDEQQKLKYCCVPDDQGQLSPAKDGDRFVCRWSFPIGHPFAEKGNTGFKVQRGIVELIRKVVDPGAAAKNLVKALSGDAAIGASNETAATNGAAIPVNSTGIPPIAVPPLSVDADAVAPAAAPARRRRRTTRQDATS